MTKRSQHRLRHGDGWIETRPTAGGELRYLARWTVRQPDGMFAKRSKSFRSEAEAERYLHQVVDRGWREGDETRLTVRDLVRDWLERGSYRWKPATHALYRQRANRHVLPVFGDRDPRTLTTPLVQRWIDDLTRRGLHASTVDGAAHVLGGACKEAVRLGLLEVNPVSATRRPTARQRPVATWSATDVQTVIAALADEPMWQALYRVALTTGMRPGELCGLRWRDLDLERGTATIRRTISEDEHGRTRVGETTKTGVTRAVALPAPTVAALRRWRPVQTAQRLAAPRWEDGDYVFTTGRGAFLPPSTWRQRHERLCQTAGVSRITLHGLRHTAASLLMEQGVHLKVVSDLLGHQRIQTTLDTYSHVSDSLQRTAVDALGGMLGMPDDDEDGEATTAAP